MHRVRAAALRGRSSIAVTFFEGTREEAFLRAVEENIAHGLPLPLADRKAAALRILTARPQLSDRAIAARTGLSAKTVAGVRRRSPGETPRVNTRIGADGRRYSRDTSQGRLRASELISARPDAPLRQIARDAGVSLGTAHDVRVRVLRGESPVPDLDVRRTTAPPTRASPAHRPTPAAHRRRPAAGSPCRGDAQGRLAVLRSLTRDPSLRGTESGRELLRWLHTQAVLDGDWHTRVSSVPAHCADAVAELARSCSDLWQRIADELEQSSAR
ncbi:ParB/RepB/Spo0J family partition protein [Streptomyces yaizuensis]|uniref:ParB/RepB/Spo0J family partition protein n=2 Tax=Streptomyces yaizuensis TaxID=2989713 RepID=A0ABQ5P8A1_9ACTN|nr:ParB/RepB/Spo0J family partition protein [Streptomyces sp. YSPA8]